MQIRLLFVTTPDDPTGPWLVSAVDEYTEDSWGGLPDWYTDEQKKAAEAGQPWREALIAVDDDAVQRLFGSRRISASGFTAGDSSEGAAGIPPPVPDEIPAASTSA